MSRFILGTSRHQTQMFPPTIDDYIGEDSEVRFIVAFVSSLDMAELGFSHSQSFGTGRPSYNPADLLCLYIYGYLNQIRSSRRLEKEAMRNLEVIWLLGGLKPDFKTIARFRQENAEAFRSVFQRFNRACGELELFGSEMVAVDGAKFKAVNSSANYLDETKLTAKLEKADARVSEYLARLNENDEDEAKQPKTTVLSKAELESKISWWQQRQQRLHAEQQQLEVLGVSELAKTDPDSVQLADRKHKKGLVGYNVQATVDARNHLIVDIDAVTDKNDLNQLARMAKRAKDELEEICPQPGSCVNAPVDAGDANAADANAADAVESPEKRTLIVLADAGYHEANQLEACEQNEIATFVPAPGRTGGRSTDGVQVTPKTEFVYSAERDSYTCTQGAELERRATCSDGGKDTGVYYNPGACTACPVKIACTQSAFRKIKRRTNEEVVERAALRLAENPAAFKQRKCLVEHVFGTLRNNGHDILLTKGLKKIKGELHLSALAYNLRRVVNILGVKAMMKAVPSV